MEDLFSNGRIADIALALLAAETAILVALRLRRNAGVRGALANAAAGACLLLALRFALDGSAWPWIAAAMALGLAAHVADLAVRLGADGPAGPRRDRGTAGARPSREPRSLHP